MRIATVVSRAPTLCGTCDTCQDVDVFGRITEYILNLDEGEAERTEDAVSWIRDGYPICRPVPGR